MSQPVTYYYPKWALPLFGALLVLTFVYLYFGEFIAPTLTLLNVNNAYWVGSQFGGTTPSFGYLVLVMSPFAGGPLAGIVLAAEVTCIAFAFSAYGLLLGLTRRWEVGFVGAAITTASPALVSSTLDSSYSVLLGLAFLFPALLVGQRLAKQFREDWVLLFALIALGLTFSEPLLGLVLAGSLALLVPLAFRGGNRRFGAVPIISAGVSGLGLFLVHPGPDLPWGTQTPLLLLLAGATGIVGFYFTRKSSSNSAFTLGAYSAASAVASIIFANQYAVFAFLLLSATLLLNVRGFTSSTLENGVKYVNVNLARVLSIVFIVLILGADLGVSFAASRGAASGQASIVSRYGNPELFQAMAWMKQNTSAGSTVLAEYPLSSWISSLGDRPVVTNFNLNSTYPSFLASYDADTMLNSTYEMRNGFMRVRDWAPVAPQRSPAISVASGDQYQNAFYVDENHLTLLNSTGGPIQVPYSNYTKVSSGFAEVNGSIALQQKYIISGVNVERDVLMGAASQVTLVYIVRANQSGVISGAQIQLWVSKDRSIGYTSLSGGTLKIDLDAGNFVVVSKGPGQTVTFGPDRFYGQPNLDATYATSSQSFTFSITVNGLNTQKVSWAKGLEVVTASDLFTKYHVSYLVVPTIVKARQLDFFGLYFPNFTSVYQNDKLTIYLVEVGAPP